jgi:DNA repair protein RadC
MVEQFGGLPGLLRAHPGEFLGISGCGEAKAALLAAALEIARRAMAELSSSSVAAESWEDRIASLARGVRYEEREFLWALFLDGAERILGEDRLSYGGLEGASLDVPLFLRKAVRLGAEDVVLLHNHPRGTTEPSREDMELTKYVKERLQVLGMRLKAHYILGNGNYERIKRLEA